jgi:hypothetical protein
VIPAWAVVAAVLCATPAEPTRYVLAVGQNEGTGDDVRLSYAQSDALSITRVFSEAGGANPKNVELLEDATATSLTLALERLRGRLEKANAQSDQLILYVSSHADGAELHLKGTRFRLSELREAIERAPVAVAVLILDTCQSGAATRPKGVRAVPLAAGPRLSNVRGKVVITSSGAFEASQESDAIQGSFFTSHWVTGLRGPADASGDGRVTLQEAYVYAHQRTIDSTFSSAGGAQHPSFNFELRGQGELVLAEPKRAASQLVLEVGSPGDYLIQRLGESVVAGHFYKPSGSVQLALAPGDYRVRVKEPAQLREGLVTVANSGLSYVRESDLSAVRLERASLKGAATSLELNVALSGLVGRAAVTGPAALFGAGLHLNLGLACPEGRLCFVGLAGVSWATGAAVEPAFVHREFSAFVGPGFGVWLGRLRAFGGVGVGALWLHQEGTPIVSTRDVLAPLAVAALEAQLKLLGSISLSLGGFAGPTFLRAQTGDSLRLSAGARLGMALTL